MAKKLSRKKIIIASIAVFIIVFAVLSFSALSRMRRGMRTDAAEVTEEIISGEVSRGDIERQFIGAGTIADVGTKKVTLAGNIKLDTWQVKNGDYVQQGDMLATVDKQSVLTAAEELNSLIKSLDSAIESARWDAVSSTLRAARSGRVKAVYAETGDNVADIMQAHGALMLLSLDGRMAVALEESTLPLGAGVTVTLESGEAVAGSVLSVTEGVATVTISDEYGAPGETVRVSAGDKTVGTGELFIHSELKLTGFTGTVNTVNAAVNAPVSAGNTLITLINTEYSGRYEKLLKQRAELEEEMQKLLTAYTLGGVTAEVSGRVSDIDETLAETERDESALTASSLAPAAPMGTMAGESTDPTQPTTPDESDGDDPDDTPPGDEPKVTEYIGRVSEIKTAEDGTVSLIIIPNGEQAGSLEVRLTDLEGKTGGVKPEEIKAGDILSLRYENGVLVSATVYQTQGGDTPAAGGEGQMPSSGGASGGMAGNGGGMSGGGMAAASGTAGEETSYDYDETTLCRITVYDTAEISVTADELDIRALSAGEEVTLTLDALPGESFTGEITELDPVGENNGGSTKYSLTVTMPRAENMLTGMNAAVYARLEAREGVLCVPTAALNEDATGVYVYTGYNPREDTLTLPVYVTTGLSDGEYTEILSGLAEGDMYYYKYADTIKYIFN